LPDDKLRGCPQSHGTETAFFALQMRLREKSRDCAPIKRTAPEAQIPRSLAGQVVYVTGAPRWDSNPRRTV